MGLLRLGRWAVLICLGAVTVATPAAARSSTGPPPATSALHATAAGEAFWVWPLDPPPVVMRAFEPPEHDWEPGHRGVDLLGTPRQPVHSIGAGTVVFAGAIAGRGVVVVDHGPLRSTYEPVTASVHPGDTVSAGDAVGLLQSVQSHCPPRTCLHLGLRRGDRYLDPLSLLGPREVRLKPMTGEFGNHNDTSSDPDQTGDASEASSARGSASPKRNPSGVGVGLGVAVGVASLFVGALGWRVGEVRQALG
ncbi:MAG: murein hydrolase activator EnvC family protein [Nocardioidaceae bacterium]